MLPYQSRQIKQGRHQHAGNWDILVILNLHFQLSDVVIARNGTVPRNEVHLLHPAHVCGINRLLVSEGIGTEALHREFEPLFGDREHDVEEQEHVGVVIAHPVHVVVVCEGPLVYTSGSKDIFMAIKKADKTMTQTHGKQTLNCFFSLC